MVSGRPIQDGYYNSCEFDKKVFQPLGAELNLHATTWRLQLSGKKPLVMNNRLARLLAFARDTFERGKTYTTDEPHSLTVVQREICVHLEEVRSSDNLHNGCPSTLLRSVPVKNEPCGGGRTFYPTVQEAVVRPYLTADSLS